jgi:hypothetical protein
VFGAVITTALLAGVTANAGAAKRWSSLKTSGQLNISDLVGTARTADGTLHVAWHRRTANGLYDLFQTPVTARGRVGTPVPIVTGWASIGGPSLLASGTALNAFFSGSRTQVTGDPSFGLDSSVSGDGGTTWSLAPTAVAAGDFVEARDSSVALGPHGLLASWYAGSETVVHLGTDPNTPSQRGYGLGTGQALAVNFGAAEVAWCTGVQGPNGVFVESVDPATALPFGAARIVPGSTSRASDGTPEAYCSPSARVPLVARLAKGFFVATVDGSRRTVIGWRVGTARSQRLAGGSAFKQYVAAAGSPRRPSVWVGWVDENGNIVLRRSNPTATVFGAPVTVPGPQDGSSFGLDLNAQADRVDLIVRVEHNDGSVGLEHAQSFPGLTLVASGHRRLSFRVLDAGLPVQNATVRVAGRSAVTGADGRVTITVTSPGRYTASASAPKYVSATAAVSVHRR